MQTLPLQDLSIKHLNHCFFPPGLPLLEKAPGARPSTTIVVRGGPGTGKSTIAVALAHDIARAGNGWALYIATEAFKVDVELKRRLLGLKASAIEWGAHAEANTGDLVVDHLSAFLLRNAAQPESAVERSEHALDMAWQYAEEVKVEDKLRVVAIDCFGLLMPGDDARGLRERVLDVAQSLESRGISVILVEECTGNDSGVLSFAADLVIELSFERSGMNRSRRLSVMKSRLAQAAPTLHFIADVGIGVAVYPSRLTAALVVPGSQILQGRKLAPELQKIIVDDGPSTRPFHGRIGKANEGDSIIALSQAGYRVGRVEFGAWTLGSIRGPEGFVLFRGTSPLNGLWPIAWAIDDLPPDENNRPLAFLITREQLGRDLFPDEFDHFIYALRNFGLVVVLGEATP